MPRHARVVCSGNPHHVTQRGNRRATVFFSDWDRLEYLSLLGAYSRRHGLDVLAYCLMPNHVHLVVVPLDRNALQRVMKPLHMRHAQRLNRMQGSNGIVWQGRYFSSVLDQTYLWNAIRYVELNPVRARLAGRAEDFPWSSAAAHCGLRHDPILTSDPGWLEKLRGIVGWSAWLEDRAEPGVDALLRRNTAMGLPCGSDEFIEKVKKSARQLPRPTCNADLPGTAADGGG